MFRCAGRPLCAWHDVDKCVGQPMSAPRQYAGTAGYEVSLSPRLQDPAAPAKAMTAAPKEAYWNSAISRPRGMGAMFFQTVAFAGSASSRIVSKMTMPRAKLGLETVCGVAVAMPRTAWGEIARTRLLFGATEKAAAIDMNTK